MRRATAALAGFAGDQLLFWIGRRHGSAVLARFPSIAHQAERVFRLIERYQAWVIVGVRFAYGLRVAGPIIIGTSGISPLKFMAFNALGAIIWAIAVASIGYLFGEAAHGLAQQIHSRVNQPVVRIGAQQVQHRCGTVPVGADRIERIAGGMQTEGDRRSAGQAAQGLNLTTETRRHGER